MQAREAHGTATDPGTKTVAVLPLRNQGPAEDAWLAEGLTDDVVDALSVVPGLRVRPRGVVSATPIEGRDPRDVGRGLGVQVVVEGSVRTLGDKIRVSTRVLSVADGFQLWAKRFDVDRAEVLRVGDAIAQAISEALVVDRAPEARPGTDTEAIEAYLRGRHEYLAFTQERNVAAVDLLARAASRFPDDPTILATYAMALARRLPSDSSPDTLERARGAAERAMQLAPTRGEPHVAACGVAVQAGKFVEGATLLARALRLAPNLADAHEYAARLWSELDDPVRAQAHADLAMRLEPRMAHLRVLMVRHAAFERRWDDVDEAFAQPPDDGTFGIYWLLRARMALWRGDKANALRVRTEFEAVDGVRRAGIDTSRIAALVGVAITGEIPDGGRQFLEDRMARSEPRASAIFAQLLCELGGSVGQDDLVLSTLAASAPHLIDIAWLDHCPLFDRVRQRPELAPIRDRVAAQADAVRAALSAQ